MDMSSQPYDRARNAHWSAREFPPPPLVLLGHTDWVRSVAFLPDGKQVISGSSDRSIRAWRVEDGDEVGTVMTDGGVVAAVAVSRDGQWIATGGLGSTSVTIWNPTTHERVTELKGHLDWVRSLGFSPDSSRVVSGSDDKMVIVWNTTTGERLAGPLKGHAGRVYSVEFSPDGDRIASCDVGDLRMWHSHTGKLVTPPIHVDARSIAWASIGQQLVLIVGCYNGCIKFFDPLTGSLLAEWNGHANVVESIAISPNDSFFASGSWDKTVRLWDTATREQIGPALQHDDEINSVAISPDGCHLASGGYDNILRVWSLQRNSQQVLNPSPQEEPDTRIAKDDDNFKDEKAGNKDNSEGVEHSLQRRPSDSSSLRRFLDRSAVPPSIGGAEGPSDQVYFDFFETDSPDAPPPVDEPPKRRFSKFLHRFSRKKTQRGAETKTQPEPQQAEANSPTDPLPTTTSKRLIEKDKGKQKESIQESTPADDNDRDSAPTPEPRPAASPPHTKRHVRNRATRIRRAMMRRERQKHTYIAELRDRPIYAWDTRPAPDEIERGCCFHLASYICYGQRDPNINPGANNAQPITQPIPSAHGVAKINLRSLGARLGRLLVRLHLRKLPPASASASASASLSAIVPPIPSPHADPSGASAPASIPLSTQPTPTSTITSPTNIPEAPVHASTSPVSSSQTPSPPPPAILRPASVDPNIDAGGVPSEMEPNPWQFTDTERVDLVSVEYMVQLDPWHNA